MVDNMLYPDKFNIGEEFYDRKFCSSFGKSFAQWLWNITSQVLRKSHDEHSSGNMFMSGLKDS